MKYPFDKIKQTKHMAKSLENLSNVEKAINNTGH